MAVLFRARSSRFMGGGLRGGVCNLVILKIDIFLIMNLL